MRNLDININRAALTGFHVSFNEDGMPDVSADIVLMTEQGKRITTHSLSTSAWRKEDKFTLPVVMIDPIKQISAALEEVVIRYMNEGQAAIEAPALVDEGVSDEVEEIEGEFDEDTEEVLEYPLDEEINPEDIPL